MSTGIGRGQKAKPIAATSTPRAPTVKVARDRLRAIRVYSLVFKTARRSARSMSRFTSHPDTTAAATTASAAVPWPRGRRRRGSGRGRY